MSQSVGAAFRRCLLELDVVGVRRLWRQVAPQMPQPENDAEALHALHIARTTAESVPERQKEYSRQWLAEREHKIVVHAVGIAIGMHGPTEPWKRDSNDEMIGEVSLAVDNAYKSGIDLDKDAKEVSLRMRQAREKLIAWRNGVFVRWPRRIRM